MTLMERMRGFTKVILYFLVLAFVGTIIFDWGMDVTGLKRNPKVIGKVNGEEISVDTFWQAYQRQIDIYQQQTGNPPSDAQLEYIRNQVWESLIRDVLVRQELEKRDIKAYDSEIRYYIFEQPADMFKTIPAFTNEQGQFDPARFQAALRDRQVGLDVENILRFNLPFQKFQDEFETTVYVTDSEIMDEYLKRNERVTVEYLFISPDRFNNAEITVSEDEIKKRYQEKKDTFKEPEKRKIEYVIFPTQATAQDSAFIEEEALDVLERARNGEDFAELAKTYSADNTAENGGDLNYFKRGAMVKPFEDAAFSAKVGEVVGPVHTQFGIHIIKVTDRKKENGEEMVRASHILFKYEPSATTISSAREGAYELSEIAKQDGWEEALEVLKLEAQTSPFFTEGSGFIPGLGIARTASRFVFTNPVGSISDPIETDQGFVALKIIDKQDEHIKPLEEVRGTLEVELKREKRFELAGDFARKIKAELDKGASFEAVAATDSLDYQKPEPFTRNSFINIVGKDPNFIGAAFALKVGEISEPVKGYRGYYIIKALDRSKFDETDFQNKKELIRQDVLDKRSRQAFNSWYTKIKEKADIEDNRAVFNL